MSKRNKVVMKWDDVHNLHTEVVKTLLINIINLKTFMQHPEYDTTTAPDEAVKIANTLTKLATEYTSRTEGLKQLIVDKAGKVHDNELHEYMHIYQQCISLNEEIVSTLVGLAEVMVLLQQRNIDTNANQENIHDDTN